jgi:hypothetical protein
LRTRKKSPSNIFLLLHRQDFLGAKTSATAALDTDDRVAFIVKADYPRNAGINTGGAPGALRFFENHAATRPGGKRPGGADLGARRLSAAAADFDPPLALQAAPRSH